MKNQRLGLDTCNVLPTHTTPLKSELKGNHKLNPDRPSNRQKNFDPNQQK